MQALVTCPNCKSSLQIPSHLLNHPVTCTQCRQQFVGGSNTSNENVYFDSDGIEVTSHRLVIHDTTYALKNVVSVRMKQLPRNNQTALTMIGFGVVGLLGAIALGVQFSAMANVSAGVSAFFVILLLSGICIAVGYYLNSKALPEYALILDTASGKQRVLISRKAQRIKSVVAALNEAIANN